MEPANASDKDDRHEGEEMTAPVMLSVYNGRDCIGFILSRGKIGFEALDRDEHSIGIFPTQREAANAISSDEGKR
jgi:hypothetical protein